MGLATRRRYRWTRRRIGDYWDEAFTTDGIVGSDLRAALEDLSAFIASLGSSRSARMRDVLGTIQAALPTAQNVFLFVSPCGGGMAVARDVTLCTTILSAGVLLAVARLVG